MFNKKIIKLFCLSLLVFYGAKNEIFAGERSLPEPAISAKNEITPKPRSLSADTSSNLITRLKAKQLIDLMILGYQDTKWYHKVDNYKSLDFDVSIDFPDMQIILKLSGKLDEDFRKKTTGDVARGHFNRFNPFNDDKHQSWTPYLVGIESFPLSKHNGNSQGLKMVFRQDIANNITHEVTGKFRILSVRYNFKDKEHKHINKDVSKFLFGNPDFLNYIDSREENQRKALEEKQNKALELQKAIKLREQQDLESRKQKDTKNGNHRNDSNESYNDTSYNNYQNCEGLTGYALRDCEDGQGGYGNQYNDRDEEDYYGYRRRR